MLAWLEVVEAARHPLTGKPLAKRSKANMVAAVSAFYTWAMQDGHTEVNPVGLVNRKKKGLNTSKDRSPTRSLDRHETHAMLKAADNDPDESVRSRTAAIVALLWEVGLRVGELCNATLADMYVQQGKRVLHVVLKGKKDHLFALPDPVCRRIDAYLASRQDLDLLPARRGEVNASTTPLFVTNTGKPMNRMEVWRLIKRIAKLAGVDHQESMSPHVARHTFITEARRQRRASEEIKDYIGHEFVSTTDRYGKHVVNLENSPFFAVAEAFEAVGDDN
ncbi:MAG: tyrosine-type recombinase/integrase [Candidatus Dormibacteria bacterium]